MSAKSKKNGKALDSERNHRAAATEVTTMDRSEDSHTLTQDRSPDLGSDRFTLIQQCAYFLWEQAGRPTSQADTERFWLQAENEINEQPNGSDVHVGRKKAQVGSKQAKSAT